jgi:hypothetical protein
LGYDHAGRRGDAPFCVCGGGNVMLRVQTPSATFVSLFSLMG